MERLGGHPQGLPGDLAQPQSAAGACGDRASQEEQSHFTPPRISAGARTVLCAFLLLTSPAAGRGRDHSPSSWIKKVKVREAVTGPQGHAGRKQQARTGKVKFGALSTQEPAADREVLSGTILRARRLPWS